MITNINHIGIAVKNLESSIELFSKIFNNNDFHREIIEDQKVEIASFKVGNVLLELTAPTNDSSTINKFIEKRGEGIHHIAFESDDIRNDLVRLNNDEVNLINDTPQNGAHNMQIAFLHPKSTNGVLIELCQPK